MNRRPMFVNSLISLLVIAVLAGCANEQGQAFLNNVGGIEGLLNNVKQATGTITEPEEIAMGHGITETLLGARPMLDDPDLQRYVNALGSWVASRSERPQLPWHFAVNDSDYVNAFAAPGGYIIVTKGMMNLIQNEAELAGVLGHEIGHVVRKHHLNAIRKGAFINLLGAGAAAGAAGSRNGQLIDALVGPTKELYARGLDKDDEFEADRIGV
ncbi:MAG: M48 family metalloprotease, partial [Betaproteobacteria bacterium]